MEKDPYIVESIIGKKTTEKISEVLVDFLPIDLVIKMLNNLRKMEGLDKPFISEVKVNSPLLGGKSPYITFYFSLKG